MQWLLVVAVLIIILVVLAGLVMRFNQLSLARDLCAEGYRQLNADIANRHLLLPAFIEAGTKRIGLTAEVEALGEAFTAARRADTVAEVGQAEQELTITVEELAETMRQHLRLNADSAATERYLYVQIRAIEGRIAAAVRYYNLSVDRYRQRRAHFFSIPFRTVFAPRAPIAYSELELDPVMTAEQALEVLGEDYRPGRLSEGM